MLNGHRGGTHTNEVAIQDEQVAGQLVLGIPGCRSFAFASQGYELLAAGTPEGFFLMLSAGQRGTQPPILCRAPPTGPAGLEVARARAGVLWLDPIGASAAGAQQAGPTCADAKARTGQQCVNGTIKAAGSWKPTSNLKPAVDYKIQAAGVGSQHQTLHQRQGKQHPMLHVCNPCSLALPTLHGARTHTQFCNHGNNNAGGDQWSRSKL